MQGWANLSNDVVPAVIVNTATVSTPFFSPVDASQIVMHGGATGDNAILRFIAPTSGSYSIVGDWESLHFGTTKNYVLHNGISLFDSINDNSSFSLTAILTAGDAIDFVVNAYNDNYFGDSTGLRATLTTSTAVPEPTSIAMWSIMGGIGFIALRKRKKTIA